MLVCAAHALTSIDHFIALPENIAVPPLVGPLFYIPENLLNYQMIYPGSDYIYTSKNT
jgi:hypothetical protein